MTHQQLSALALIVPPRLAQPARCPTLEPPFDWESLSPASKLVIARLFGRAADRNAVADAWDQVRAWGVTMRELANAAGLPAPVLQAVRAKIGYTNRHGT